MRAQIAYVVDKWSFFRGSFVLYNFKMGPIKVPHCSQVLAIRKLSVTHVWLWLCACFLICKWFPPNKVNALKRLLVIIIKVHIFAWEMTAQYSTKHFGNIVSYLRLIFRITILLMFNRTLFFQYRNFDQSQGCNLQETIKSLL